MGGGLLIVLIWDVLISGQDKSPEPNAIKLSVNPEPLCTCDQFRWGLSCLI